MTEKRVPISCHNTSALQPQTLAYIDATGIYLYCKHVLCRCEHRVTWQELARLYLDACMIDTGHAAKREEQAG